MATTVYNSETILLIDSIEIKAMPLKIKYLREFMKQFDLVKNAKDDIEAISKLSECARICMQQYYPKIKTIEDLEDSVDLPTIYKILDIAGGVTINETSEESVKKQATESSNSWEDLDLAKLESEAFLLGIWKDYEELELSLSMPELMITLESKRESDYETKKFLAAIQGVDIEKNSSSGNEWEQMKARHFSGGQTGDPNDVVALQGANAAKAGFGIGLGLSYQKIDKKS